nr:zinc ribbon domain-containing protein [Candidatus Sigynarchaeota archaeon]
MAQPGPSAEDQEKIHKYKVRGTILVAVGACVTMIGPISILVRLQDPGHMFDYGIIGFMAPMLIFMLGGFFILIYGQISLRRWRLMSWGIDPKRPIGYMPSHGVIYGMPPPQPYYPPPAPAPQTVVKVKCKACGNLNDEKAGFCSTCGAKL